MADLSGQELFSALKRLRMADPDNAIGDASVRDVRRLRDAAQAMSTLQNYIKGGAQDPRVSAGGNVFDPATGQGFGSAVARQRAGAADPRQAIRSLLQAKAALRNAAGTGADYAADAESDLDQIAPLVQRGVMDERAVQAVVQSAAMGGLVDRRNRRKAQRELQAILQQTENGTFNETQTAGAMQSLEKEYPQELLLSTPEYVKAKGLGRQMQVAREQKKQELAEQFGVEPDVLKFDDDKGQWGLDPNAVAINQYKMATEEYASTKAYRERQTKQNGLSLAIQAGNNKVRAIGAALQAAKNRNQNPAALFKQLDKVLNEQTQLSNALAGLGQSYVETAATGGSADAKSYTRQSYAEAVSRGEVKNGDLIVLDGVPGVVVNGKPRPR